MGKKKKDKEKKAFRITPGQAQDAMKIIVGNKTNATIRDIEEEEGELEEKMGTVVSITRDKINGVGWVVQDEEGNTYNCSCASSMYDMPATTERGGVLYPDSSVTVKFTINPVLRTNTITEITSLGEDESTLDISEWRHGDEATTIIAKPKSAISISNSKISFNYNNKNTVVADEEAVSIEGETTNIITDVLNIESDVNIKGIELTDYIIDYSLFALLEYDNSTQTSNEELGDLGLSILQQSGMGQIIMNSSLNIPNTETIIGDLKNPIMFPSNRQRHPLLSDDDIDDLSIYPNGLITIRNRNNNPDVKKNINTTINWISSPYEVKNVISVNVGRTCNCCQNITGSASYFNYCPNCQTWRTLSNINNQIVCTTCKHTFCEACGHDQSQQCSIKGYDLKKYEDNKISGVTTSCDYCEGEIPVGEEKEYANWCPFCHQWGYLHIKDSIVNNKSKRTLECTYCNKSFCLNCSTLQEQVFVNSFSHANIHYDDNSKKKIDSGQGPMDFRRVQFTKVI